MKPVILIPVHNRRETSLRCLARLHTQGVPRWARILVVDDGSTDGTGPAIRHLYPDTEMIAGDGRLFWTGAIALGMHHAFSSGAPQVLWLNDDCGPEPEALQALCAAAHTTNGIVGGLCVHPETGAPVYGGFQLRRGALVFLGDPGSTPVRADALNGNLVCVPSRVPALIGWPDARRLPHAYGDTDYTLRASRAGIPVHLLASARATAIPGVPDCSWLLSTPGPLALLRRVTSKRSYDYLPANAVWQIRHFGLRGLARTLGWLIRLPLIVLLRLLVPVRWLRVVWGSRSRAWRADRSAAERKPQP